MGRKFLGLLQNEDPLYDYLKYDIQPQLTDFCDNPVYLVYGLNGSNAVYLYEEKNTQTKIIGKYFFSEREKNRQTAADRRDITPIFPFPFPRRSRQHIGNGQDKRGKKQK